MAVKESCLYAAANMCSPVQLESLWVAEVLMLLLYC